MKHSKCKQTVGPHMQITFLSTWHEYQTNYFHARHLIYIMTRDCSGIYENCTTYERCFRTILGSQQYVNQQTIGRHVFTLLKKIHYFFRKYWRLESDGSKTYIISHVNQFTGITSFFKDLARTWQSRQILASEREIQFLSHLFFF